MNQQTPQYDCCILNSVSNVAKALFEKGEWIGPDGKTYTAELESHWTENIHDSKDYVYLHLDKDDAQSLIEELTELSEVNLRDTQRLLSR